MDGETMKTMYDTSEPVKIDDLPNGMYIVKVKTDDAEVNLKLLIRK